MVDEVPHTVLKMESEWMVDEVLHTFLQNNRVDS